jgi:hypothetical protein
VLAGQKGSTKRPSRWASMLVVLKAVEWSTNTLSWSSLAA